MDSREGQEIFSIFRNVQSMPGAQSDSTPPLCINGVHMDICMSFGKYIGRDSNISRFLVNDQRDAQILFYVFISIYNSLHVSSISCSSSGETNCINTASGNSHSMLVAEMCAGCKKTGSSSNLHTSRLPI